MASLGLAGSPLKSLLTESTEDLISKNTEEIFTYGCCWLGENLLRDRNADLKWSPKLQKSLKAHLKYPVFSAQAGA